jgi:hypothetical protein
MVRSSLNSARFSHHCPEPHPQPTNLAIIYHCKTVPLVKGEVTFCLCFQITWHSIVIRLPEYRLDQTAANPLTLY